MYAATRNNVLHTEILYSFDKFFSAGRFFIHTIYRCDINIDLLSVYFSDEWARDRSSEKTISHFKGNYISSWYVKTFE